MGAALTAATQTILKYCSRWSNPAKGKSLASMPSAKRSSWDVRAVAEAAVVDFGDYLNVPALRQADSAGQGRSPRPVKAESQPEPTIGLFEIAHNGKFTRLQPSGLGAAQGRDRPIGSQPSESSASLWGY
jgi:hypothetical protein